MQAQSRNKSILLVSAMILLAALSRLLPHPPNVAPIGAMALFGAAYLKQKHLALIIPFAALWISNLLLDNLVYGMYYEHFMWFSNPGVFLSFLLIVLLGFGLLKQISAGRIFGASLAASVLFFLVTNFFSWLSYGLYPMNLAGLLACYTAAIPFFWNTLAGDLFFVLVLFGGYEWISSRYPGFSFSK
ncbi:MAG: hypothetical protein KDC34_00320 [Saprospiraceae bacterium]|nr:hypothetical protein [Saprospiraceae bacterium]